MYGITKQLLNCGSGDVKRYVCNRRYILLPFRGSGFHSAHGKEHAHYREAAESYHADMHAVEKSVPGLIVHWEISHKIMEDQSYDRHAAKHAQGPHGGQKAGCNAIMPGCYTAHDGRGVG
jgi:hypothetical protein